MRLKFTTLPVQVDETKPAEVVVSVQVDKTKPNVVVIPVQVDKTKPSAVPVLNTKFRTNQLY